MTGKIEEFRSFGESPKEDSGYNDPFDTRFGESSQKKNIQEDYYPYSNDSDFW